MPYKHFKTQKDYDAQRYKDNREKNIARSKKYKKDHPEESKQYDAQRYKDNREENIARSRKYRKDHPEVRKQHYKDNREKILAQTKQYRKDHPEVNLRVQKKLYKKIGITRYQIQAWTKVIRKGKNCSYCDSDKKLHSHHLLTKAKYPGLALNENNGIPLCVTCHREHHSLNGVTA